MATILVSEEHNSACCQTREKEVVYLRIRGANTNILGTHCARVVEASASLLLRQLAVNRVSDARDV
jgi:hypothetical protein